MYVKALSGLFVCCTLLSAAESQVVITDADPSEYPHIARIEYKVNTIPLTVPALFVSAKYVLASLITFGTQINKNMFKLTDQLGVVYPVGKVAADADQRFFYMKLCKTFTGTPFNMSESSFDSLANTVEAQMLFFPTTSNTLKKVSVSLLDNTTCNTKASAILGVSAASIICMTSTATTNFCLDTFADDLQNPTYVTISVVAIGGQVNGLFRTHQCVLKDLSSVSPYFFYRKISYHRQEIIDLIPTVDIV
ncbi:uncharacterized protein LOC135939468 [Cloeon dipterum]|uniref:uncharacterized protein LOC135939468 n=1 Tax=Cloeon dipterum TaxID=197152 RepID=UPI0032202DFF